MTMGRHIAVALAPAITVEIGTETGRRTGLTVIVTATGFAIAMTAVRTTRVAIEAEWLARMRPVQGSRFKGPKQALSEAASQTSSLSRCGLNWTKRLVFSPRPSKLAPEQSFFSLCRSTVSVRV